MDAALSASQAGSMARHLGGSYVDNTLLLQLVGKSVRLQALDLSGCSVTPSGLLELAAAHAACRGVDADAATGGAGPGATGGSGDAAAAAQRNTESTVVPAAAADDDGADAQQLAAAAAVQGALHIRDLQLDGSALASDEGLVAVGQCCCETLEQLVVRNAGRKLGDEGIRGLKGCTHLSTLDITGCSVTEEGKQHLLMARLVVPVLAMFVCFGDSRGHLGRAAQAFSGLAVVHWFTMTKQPLLWLGRCAVGWMPTT